MQPSPSNCSLGTPAANVRIHGCTSTAEPTADDAEGYFVWQ